MDAPFEDEKYIRGEVPNPERIPPTELDVSSGPKDLQPPVAPINVNAKKIKSKGTGRGLLARWKEKFIFPHHHRLHARYATPAVLKMSAWKSFLEGIFVSRELAPKEDRDIYIRYSVREIAVYSVYLFIISLMTVGAGSSTPFLYKEMMTHLFLDKPLGPGNLKTLQTSASVEDFWSYVKNVLPNVLYSEIVYDEKWPVRQLNNSEKFGILYENQLVGVPRFRQIRVRSDNCPVAENFRYLTRQCFPPYRHDHEEAGDKKKSNSWTDGPPDGPAVKAWQYKTEEELGGSHHIADLTTYSGGGAVQDLAKTKKPTVDIIDNLYRGLWVTRATRVVFLDFTVYNANLNLFCIVRIVWEFPATGGLTTSWSFRTLRLIRYVTWFESYVVFPSEILFCIFTLYYIIQEILEFKRMGLREYFRDVYSYLDITLLVTSLVVISLAIFQSVILSRRLQILKAEVKDFQDFEFVGYWQSQLNNAVGFVVFFAWVKAFKYILFNKTMIQLAATLSRCSQDIGGFAVMFFIVFFAFAQLGYLLFGSQVRDFRTFENSVFTLLRLIVGEFDFRRIEAASRVLGPIFFLAYVFFIFFVLLNMFLAIMTDTYSEVKAEIQAQRNEFEVSDYIKRSFNNFLGLFGRRNVHMDAQDAVKLAPVDGQLTYAEIKKAFQRANFTDIEIKIFLERYGLKPDGSLDEEDTQQILDNLEGESQQENEPASTAGTGIPKPGASNKQVGLREQFVKMQNRVVNLEVGLTGLIHKIGNITERLQDQAD